jgi:hypothetical protein
MDVFFLFLLISISGLGSVSLFGFVQRARARANRGRLVASLRQAHRLPETTLEDEVHWEVQLRDAPAILVVVWFVPETALQARLRLFVEAPPLHILPARRGEPRAPLVAELRESLALREPLERLAGQVSGVELHVRDQQLVFRCRASADALQRADQLLDEAIAPLLARLWRDRERLRDDVPLCPWDEVPLVATDTAPDDLHCPTCRRRALNPERVAHLLERTGDDVGGLRTRAERQRRSLSCGFCGTHLSVVAVARAALHLCEGCGALYGKPREVARLTRLE